MLRNWRKRQGGQHAGSGVPAQPASAMPCVADPAAEISRLRRENDRPRMERDVSGKAVVLLLGSAETRFRLIEDQRDVWPVCGKHAVSAAGWVSLAALPAVGGRRLAPLR